MCVCVCVCARARVCVQLTNKPMKGEIMPPIRAAVDPVPMARFLHVHRRQALKLI